MSVDKKQEILDFWFSEIERTDWYRKSDSFDAIMRQRFSADVDNALEGRLDDWARSPDGRLALILLLDQMTRNLFRDTPRAFSGDEIALGLSQAAVAEGQVEQELNVFRRIFLLMPFMHSEDMAVEQKSVTLFAKYADANSTDFAQRHLSLIEQFGRFPHRNKILGRASTDAEKEYLAQPDAGF
ncbi:MAG: DUF924 domain-containing protein [Alphaproteobacteria bacterium]|nr:DUF924 domain-containing protein [Alphaproteobacteria bacterium]